jgi:hypothetical protein
MSKLLSCILPLCLSLACGAQPDTSTDFREALTDTRSENDEHAARCVQATSLQAMAQEMARHEPAMQDFLERMDAGLSHMGHCFLGDMQTMHDMMSGLHAADAAHREHMQSAQSLDAASAECHEYTSATHVDLDHMDGMMTPGTMSCM